MTNFKITNAGERILIGRALRQDGGALSIRLSAADIAADDDTTLADVTQPAFVEYADVALVDTNWTVPVTNVDEHAETEYPEIIWSYESAAAESIYGIVIHDGTDIVSIELFETPITIEGDSALAITPRILGYDTADS